MRFGVNSRTNIPYPIDHRGAFISAIGGKIPSHTL